MYKKTERIKYIDALRGFTMLVVVLHVRFFSLNLLIETSPFAIVFFTFMLPMFFFISGYVAYKGELCVNKGAYSKRLLNKATVLLIPTLVFWVVFIYFQIRPWNFPGGFWFTEVLFEMFLIYFTVALLFSKMNSSFEDISLVGIAILLFISKRFISNNSISEFITLRELCSYFIFFVLGLMAKKHNDRFIRIVSNKYYLALGILIPLISLAITSGPLNISLGAGLSGVLSVCNGILLVSVIFALFRSSSDYWNRNGLVQRSFEFIGRRTLDLYMLHYFLLPSLPEIGKYFADGHNYTLELLVTGILTLLITGCALAISTFLRTSPILAKYLFGVSPKPSTLAS